MILAMFAMKKPRDPGSIFLFSNYARAHRDENTERKHECTYFAHYHPAISRACEFARWLRKDGEMGVRRPDAPKY